MNAESIISKVWSFCTTLRDGGLDIVSKYIKGSELLVQKKMMYS